MRIILLLLVIFYSNISYAFEYNSKALLKFDSEIYHGSLGNGLKFYIQESDNPKEVGYLRLIINVGSLQEEDDQQGIAHFVEHMAFNGSSNFKSGDIIEFMESIGMEYGPEVNASTSFGETIYKLKVPTNDKIILEKSFRILADWASEVSFDEASLENEKKVIVEEWRQGLGFSKRKSNLIVPIIYANSKYKDRLPIGDMDQINNFTSDDLKEFYQEWYRPNLMSIVAVGDFNTIEVERLITKYFGNLKNPIHAKERNKYFIPKPESSYNIITDPEQVTSSFSVKVPIESKEFQIQADYFENFQNEIAYSIFYERMNDISKEINSPFEFAYIYESSLGEENNNLELFVRPIDGKYIESIERIKKEYDRIQNYGFSKIEFDNLIVGYKSSLEDMYNNKNSEETIDKLDYLMSFINSESVFISTESYYNLSLSILDKITLDDINFATKNWFNKKNRTIIIQEPEVSVKNLPTDKEFISILDSQFLNTKKLEIKDWTNIPLFNKEIKQGEIIKQIYYENIDVTELRLSNGVRVVIKSTNYEEDNIILYGQSPGGLSVANNDIYESVSQINNLFRDAGVGEFNSNNLSKKLLPTPVTARPGISEYAQSFDGESNKENFELMLQLLYLYFTDIHYEKEELERYKRDNLDDIQKRLLNPDTVFFDHISKVRFNNHIRMQPITSEILKSLDYDVMFDFYTERFSDASDFTFYIVGNVSLEKDKDMIVKYLGNLPSLDRDNQWRDINLNQVTGGLRETIRNNPEPQSFTYLIYSGPFEYNIKNRLDYLILGESLNIHLNEVIREELGGVYSIGAYQSAQEYPKPIYNFYINFQSDPNRQEELVKSIKKEIQNFMTGKFDDNIVLNATKQSLQNYAEEIETNDFWIGTLSFYDWHEEPYENVFLIKDIHNQRTKQDIVDIANQIFNTENIMEFIQLPK